MAVHVLGEVAIGGLEQFSPIMRKGGAQGPPVFTGLDRAASFEH